MPPSAHRVYGGDDERCRVSCDTLNAPARRFLIRSVIDLLSQGGCSDPRPSVSSANSDSPWLPASGQCVDEGVEADRIA